jgi:hypothetical protein
LRHSPPLVTLAFATLFGCGRYADFTLPAPGPAEDIIYKVSAVSPPLVGRGAPGAWDSSDVLNPSVVVWRGFYLNLYSGFDGRTWRTGAAISPDGERWEKLGPVLAPDPASWEGDYIAANGSAFQFGHGLLYWYQAGRPPRIGLAESDDGRTWRKRDAPVMGTGPRGSWDERAAADPYVAAFGDFFYMYYLGQDRANRQMIGLARSRDGVAWTKLRASPVLEPGGPGEFDERGAGEPAVWAASGWYWMLYTGRDSGERRRIGLAKSRDGVSWAKLGVIFAGGNPENRNAWNREVVCDPTVLHQGREVRVWYGGGDVARPDERIDGQIGMFTLMAEPAR